MKLEIVAVMLDASEVSQAVLCYSDEYVLFGRSPARKYFRLRGNDF